MALHEGLTHANGAGHQIHYFEFANAAAREAGTGYTIGSEHVKKWALQTDDNTMWMLTNHSPITWVGQQAAISGAASTVVSSNLTADRAVIANGSGKIAVSTVSASELAHVSGVTSAIQTQLNNKSDTSHDHSGTYEPADAAIQTHITNTDGNPHGTDKTDIGLSNVTNDAQIPLSQKNAANGVCPLGADSKVPTANLPATVLGAVQYKGAWNADTNSPDLPAASPEQGDYYVVSTPGSTSLGGITDWKTGDWAIYNGAAWEKVDNTDAVTSVHGRTGAIVAADDDYAASNITDDSDVGAGDVAGALTALNSDKASVSHDHAGTYEPLITGAATTINDTDLTASRALIANASGKVAVSLVTDTELGYLDGVTSDIQTQLNGKAASGHDHSGVYEPVLTGAATTINDTDLTANRAVIANASGKVAVSTVTDTELGYVSGVTSAIQTQLNGKSDTSHNHSGTYEAANANIQTHISTTTGNPHSVSKSDVGLGNVTNDAQIPLTQKGAASGVCPLTAGQVIDEQYLPDSIVGQVEYQGTWTASTNTPSIPAAASGNKGYYYICSDSVSSGHGYSNVPDVDFATGDWIISNGSSWSKVDNTDAVPTVFSRTGNVVAAASDYDASQIDNDSTVSGAFVDDALTWLNTNKAASTHNHTGVYEPVITGGATSITSSNLTASRAVVSDGSGKVAVSATTSTELGYVSGVTSAIQTQLNGKAASSHNHSGTYEPAFGKNSAFNKSFGGSGSSASVARSDHTHTNLTEYDLPVTFHGAPTASQVIAVIPILRSTSIATTGHRYAAVGAVATASASFTVKKNGTSAATFSVGTSATGTITLSASISLSAGDYLTIEAPATPDATLDTFGINLAATM